MLTQQPNRPFCQNCNTGLAKFNGISKHGFKKWHKYCSSCAKALYTPKFNYLLEKKSKCDKCGFIPQDLCQLDLVYKDGNKSNKAKKNLITLCANCNRLYQKTIRAKKALLDMTVDADVRL